MSDLVKLSTTNKYLTSFVDFGVSNQRVNV